MRHCPLARAALRFLAVFAIPAVAACGGSGAARPEATAPAPAVSETAAEPAASAEPPAPTPVAKLPDACADPAGPICAPPGDFVERLCAKPLQDVALALFAKETPFTRLYLRGKLDELEFDEEVLALRFHGPQKGGMVVGSGAGTYDVLRWDGSCSRGVEAEALSKTRPARPRSARVQWHRVSPSVQDALIAGSEPVKKAHAKRGKECQGAMSGDVSKACVDADRALVDAIVDQVRSKGGVPAPSTLP